MKKLIIALVFTLVPYQAMAWTPATQPPELVPDITSWDVAWERTNVLANAIWDEAQEDIADNAAADQAIRTIDKDGSCTYIIVGDMAKTIYDTDTDSKADEAEGLTADTDENIVIQLGDNAGTTEIIFKDLSGATLGTLDSNGNLEVVSMSSSGGDGSHYFGVINGAAITAPTTDGLYAFYDGRLRRANGTNWTSEWIVENWAFAGNTETGIAATAQTDGTIDLVVDDDVLVNTIVLTGLDVSATSTGKKIRIPGAAVWVSAFSWCDQAANTLVYQIERATSLGGSFTSLGYLQHDSAAVSDTDTDIAGFTDPNAGDWIRVNVTGTDADVTGVCTVALSLTVNTTN